MDRVKQQLLKGHRTEFVWVAHHRVEHFATRRGDVRPGHRLDRCTLHPATDQGNTRLLQRVDPVQRSTDIKRLDRHSDKDRVTLGRRQNFDGRHQLVPMVSHVVAAQDFGIEFLPLGMPFRVLALGMKQVILMRD